MIENEFLYKPFVEYSTVEGFLLLFLLLAFCWFLWKCVIGVIRWVL